MRVLNIQNIILFHEKIIKETGGSTGIRDRGLIESALDRAFATYDGVDLYPSVVEKISVIAHSLISNLGFIDGNKRIGVAAMIMLLKINNITIYYSQQELIDLGIGAAEGSMNEKDILNWINERVG
ncbi:type II toxin-antitoxin system death-on-curing family toxin [Alkaliphilus sp. B6464]|uniref:type II toxin-antitoxin system death-on-curing family toxin n=1 Tax=Alkaliphilus sp. B6464 TaxID=2731219 RepID=UPI001BAB89CE|nr:type II toxin-antitoxin system death-on-curing family toxin [Alkaliphilus sp. B6464]QUH21995.1 type II toxin-antitoxin system death-on-curing family toxin [Alkaliphilus sp. B6464]